MAITLASNLAPAGGKSFYLLEDVYMKGGLQIKDNVAGRDQIALTNLKLGSLVLTIAEGKIWKVTDLTLPSIEDPTATPSVTWEEFLTNSAGGVGDAPEDGKIYGRQNGDWFEVPTATAVPGSLNTRTVAIQTIDGLVPDIPQEFALTLSVSCIVLKLTVSRPVKVQAFGTPAKDEPNPYEFIATSDHLTDDGSMLLSDGTVFRTRNFSILANMESPPTNSIYFTVSNVDDSEGSVTLTLTYLPLELLPDDGSGDDTGDGEEPSDPETPSN